MTKSVHTQLWLKEGATVTNEGREYVIVALADINLVLAKEVASGEKVLLKLGDLGPAKPIGTPKETPANEFALLDIFDEDWRIAEERRRLITPLLEVPFHQWANAQADKIAEEAQVSRATVYRWVNAFRKTGLLSSLLPSLGATGGKGKSRLSEEVDALIIDAIETFYDTQQKPTMAATVEEIRRRCANAGIPLPAYNSIRLRIQRRIGRVMKRLRMISLILSNVPFPMQICRWQSCRWIAPC